MIPEVHISLDSELDIFKVKALMQKEFNVSYKSEDAFLQYLKSDFYCHQKNIIFGLFITSKLWLGGVQI